MLHCSEILWVLGVVWASCFNPEGDNHKKVRSLFQGHCGVNGVKRLATPSLLSTSKAFFPHNISYGYQYSNPVRTRNMCEPLHCRSAGLTWKQPTPQIGVYNNMSMASTLARSTPLSFGTTFCLATPLHCRARTCLLRQQDGQAFVHPSTRFITHAHRSVLWFILGLTLMCTPFASASWKLGRLSWSYFSCIAHSKHGTCWSAFMTRAYLHEAHVRTRAYLHKAQVRGATAVAHIS